MQCINQKTIWPHRSVEWVDAGGVEKPISVPCGKCIPCTVNKRMDWCFRLEQEHKVSKSAYFVTLTYDQKHIRTSGSLCKRDLQLYLKRLRKRHVDGARIRYYAVGEYGSKSGRPHYHILLFNSDQEHIRASWCDSKGRSIGLVHVGSISARSISYVTKYMIQKDEYPQDLEPPFALMSRAYGIGGNYLSDAMVDWHRDNDANYAPIERGRKGRLPRFYREKIWHRDKDKERISAAALALTLKNQELEREYYKRNHGDQWEAIMIEARDSMLSRIKQKVQYTQTL